MTSMPYVMINGERINTDLSITPLDPVQAEN